MLKCKRIFLLKTNKPTNKIEKKRKEIRCECIQNKFLYNNKTKQNIFENL